MAKLNSILKETNFISVSGNSDIEVSSITCNSREVTPGSIFVCIKGFKSDGHKYLDDAISRGAVCAVITEDVPDKGITTIKVEDSRFASVISKNSDTPFAAALAREYIFSDAGQINLAKSGALPTRTDVVVPDEYKAFDPSTYANAVSSFSDAAAYAAACEEVSEWWGENIIPLLSK